ncbi:MAG: hypothetical protein ACTMIC_11265, partial [Cellulosimicrobium funkei]
RHPRRRPAAVPARVTDPDGSAATVPVGVKLGADHGDDALLLALAARLEEAAPWSHRRPGTSS